MLYGQTEDMFNCRVNHLTFQEPQFIAEAKTIHPNYWANSGQPGTGFLVWNPVFMDNNQVSIPVQIEGINYVQIIDLETGEMINSIRTNDFALAHVWSPDQKQLLYINAYDFTMRYVAAEPYRDVKLYPNINKTHHGIVDMIWGKDNQIYLIAGYPQLGIDIKFVERNLGRLNVVAMEDINTLKESTFAANTKALPHYQYYRNPEIGKKNANYQYQREEGKSIYILDTIRNERKLVLKNVADYYGEVYVSPNREYILYATGTKAKSLYYFKASLNKPQTYFINLNIDSLKRSNPLCFQSLYNFSS